MDLGANSKRIDIRKKEIAKLRKRRHEAEMDEARQGEIFKIDVEIGQIEYEIKKLRR